MGFKSIFEDAAQQVFEILADLMVPATYTPRGAQAYDPATGTVTDPSVTSYSLSVRTEKFSSWEIDGMAIRATDMKVIFPVADLAVVPQIDDTIAIEGETWRIVNYMNEDGAKILWTLQVRRP